MISQAASDVLRLRLQLDQKFGPGIEPPDKWLEELDDAQLDLWCLLYSRETPDLADRNVRATIVRVAAIAIGAIEAIDYQQEQAKNAPPEPSAD